MNVKGLFDKEDGMIGQQLSFPSLGAHSTCVQYDTYQFLTSKTYVGIWSSGN